MWLRRAEGVVPVAAIARVVLLAGAYWHCIQGLRVLTSIYTTSKGLHLLSLWMEKYSLVQTIAGQRCDNLSFSIGISWIELTYYYTKDHIFCWDSAVFALSWIMYRVFCAL